MRYQLTLQFREDSLADYDAIIALEAELASQLGDSADVDGHDCGSGETNIFIFTLDPPATFQGIKPVLQRAGRLQAVAAAYQEVGIGRYTVIWPEGSPREFRIT